MRVYTNLNVLRVYRVCYIFFDWCIYIEIRGYKINSWSYNDVFEGLWQVFNALMMMRMEFRSNGKRLKIKKEKKKNCKWNILVDLGNYIDWSTRVQTFFHWNIFHLGTVYVHRYGWKISTVGSGAVERLKRKRFTLARRLLLGNVGRELLPFSFLSIVPLLPFVSSTTNGRTGKSKGTRKCTPTDHDATIFTRPSSSGLVKYGEKD